ncbi:MAG: holin [Clostridiales bacterium]|nr:holin [Clostridiales bacterium]
MIDLTPLFQAVIALLAALITGRLIPWIKKKVDAENMNMLAAATRTLVFAAEQIYGAGRGEEKLEYVISRLEKKGFTVDIDAIEAAVKEM